MSQTTDTIPLSSCGCCESGAEPDAVSNPPGQPALKYRIGTQGSFFRRMKESLSSVEVTDGSGNALRPLLALTSREDSDPIIALLDACATTADVLTFYQERIANEGYLRTATERRSLLELAREIGYELRPGVAASAYLVFVVESAAGAPGVATIPKSTRVQNIPKQGKLPQSFETTEDFTAYATWNDLVPRKTQPPVLDSTASTVYLQGIFTDIKVNDLVLFVKDDVGSITTTKRVAAVSIDSVTGQTKLTLDNPPKSSPPPPAATIKVSFLDFGFYAFNQFTFAQHVSNKLFSEQQLTAFTSMAGWNYSNLVAHVNRPIYEVFEPIFVTIQDKLPDPTPGLFRFKTKLGSFGNIAPKWASLSVNMRQIVAQPDATAPAYPNNWDGADILNIHQNSAKANYSTADFYCEREVAELNVGSWMLLQGNGPPLPVRVLSVRLDTLADFAISGKATGVTLEKVSVPANVPAIDLTGYKMRSTTFSAVSEQLTLAQLPITADIGKGKAENDRLTLDKIVKGLQIGQAVSISGEQADLPGVMQTEILLLQEIVHDFKANVTTIMFTTEMQFSYTRKSVHINANVVAATHGETVREVLGSGSGAMTNQKFTLKKPPLTYVTAKVPGGAADTLTVRVNDLAWLEEPTLYGLNPHDQKYIVRIDDDHKASVLFGDGISGARLPSGQENVTAVYRSGIGRDGAVDAGSLSLLAIRPLGVRNVSNPLPASGYADPEDRDAARVNAPRTVLTLDRIVSLQDFEDYSRSYAGIGKAQAASLYSQGRQLVHITISGEDGTDIPVTSKTFLNLVGAIDGARDTSQEVRVAGYEKLLFKLSAGLRMDTRYIPENVISAGTAALSDAFSFDKRSFGQPVSEAEVINVLQSVPGVIAVEDTNISIYSAQQASLLPSLRARWQGGEILPAQLVLINPFDIKLINI